MVNIFYTFDCFSSPISWYNKKKVPCCYNFITITHNGLWVTADLSPNHKLVIFQPCREVLISLNANILWNSIWDLNLAPDLNTVETQHSFLQASSNYTPVWWIAFWDLSFNFGSCCCIIKVGGWQILLTVFSVPRITFWHFLPLLDNDSEEAVRKWGEGYDMQQSRAQPI